MHHPLPPPPEGDANGSLASGSVPSLQDHTNGHGGHQAAPVAPISEPDSRDEQLCGVAHDLKEPLTVVQGHLDLLAEKLDRTLTGDQLEHLETAIDGANRALERVTAFVAYNREAVAGPDLVRVAAEDALDEAIANLGAEQALVDATITHEDLPVLRINRDHLVRLFENLLGNAMKYRSDAPLRIRVSSYRLPGGYRFSVQDNGTGIPLDQQEEIFEIFSRGDDDADRPGSGVGLAVCRKIVDGYRGRIWVESEPGEGSTFHFTLRTELAAVEASA